MTFFFWCSAALRLFPQALVCGFSNSPLRTQRGLQGGNSKIRCPVARHVPSHVPRLVPRLVPRQFPVKYLLVLFSSLRRGHFRYTKIFYFNFSFLLFIYFSHWARMRLNSFGTLDLKIFGNKALKSIVVYLKWPRRRREKIQ